MFYQLQTIRFTRMTMKYNCMDEWVHTCFHRNPCKSATQLTPLRRDETRPWLGCRLRRDSCWSSFPRTDEEPAHSWKPPRMHSFCSVFNIHLYISYGLAFLYSGALFLSCAFTNNIISFQKEWAFPSIPSHLRVSQASGPAIININRL